MIKEIWKPIKGYEGLYEISSLGRVKSLERYVANNGGKYLIKERILKPTKNQYGYLYVVISKNNINKHKLIHRLVAETFISNKHSKRTINHINGIKTDNTLENLEWCTHKHNNREARRLGLNKGYKGLTWKKRCQLAVEYIEEHSKESEVKIYGIPECKIFKGSIEELKTLLKEDKE